MPAPTRAAIGSFDVDLCREQSYNISDLQLHVQSNIPKLTCEQKGIYDRIMQMINDGCDGEHVLADMDERGVPCMRNRADPLSHQPWRRNAKERRGRPPTRWLDDVEKDIKLIGINHWKAIVTGRFNWWRIIVQKVVEQVMFLTDT
ncbi:ATP-dependent DNA helicase [Trichonephila inaurata madagascariensis]|uniref:ATP-dependent DNA helicase n=1 Tax=Trichonephila inaurata madagascariensis TaxID=2747483 RepID=A0A8X6X9G4_9ARAC|nr:ATP-dependent DNA helicase [Trichonephila inaurata madagascariensis]